MIIAIDSETTGVDWKNGTRPYFFTTCDENGTVRNFEWPVDPLDRSVVPDDADLHSIQIILDHTDELILHSAKFDAHALASVGLELPWHKTHCTLTASHILASKLRHGLDDLADQYLNKKINRYEDRLEEVCQAARRYCRTHYPDWMIAKEGLECMPSAKEKCWKADTWLPKCVAQTEGFSTEPGVDDEDRSHWHTVAAEYATMDSVTTMLLWPVMLSELHRRKLYKNYLAKMKVNAVAYRMERYGVTVNGRVLVGLHEEYATESDYLGRVCVGIAEGQGFDLDLPKKGRNKSLDAFLFDHLKLPALDYTDTGRPKLDADTKERYEHELPQGSMAQRFMTRLNTKSEYDTACSYLESYQKFMLPEPSAVPSESVADYARLYPNLNPNGTHTLRWSHNNPNSANISKQSRANLRRAFGPMPGRVWYSFDAQNIELRIPAYEAGEKELIEVFDHPEQGPYYGSYHLVVFDTLHPHLFAQHGKECKTLFEDSWYQWVKNGNFARQYGAQERKVDSTYHVEGGYKKVANRFPNIDRLSRKITAEAERTGLVWTIPDKLVDAERGYPLMTKLESWERQSPTIPFCYHVSGTACQWMNAAMVAVDTQLCQWREEGFDAHMILTVHDELVVDLPTDSGNDDRAISLKKLMEAVGERISVPTPVTVERHEESWAKGVAV